MWYYIIFNKWFLALAKFLSIAWVIISNKHIDMILPDGVTQPHSLTIYFGYSSDTTRGQFIPRWFEYRFFDENKYEKNATIGFNFTGNWETCRTSSWSCGHPSMSLSSLTRVEFRTTSNSHSRMTRYSIRQLVAPVMGWK